MLSARFPSAWQDFIVNHRHSSWNRTSFTRHCASFLPRASRLGVVLHVMAALAAGQDGSEVTVLYASLHPTYAVAFAPTGDFIAWPVSKPHEHLIAFHQLTTANSPDPRVVERLVQELDGDTYERRQSAYVSLAEFGRDVEPRLRTLIADSPSTEVRQRVSILLASMSALAEDAHQGDILAMAVSPDGKQVATGSKDHVVKVWSPARGRVSLELRGHTEAVYALAFSPDGSLLASGSADNSIRLWDMSTGDAMAEFKAHKSVVHELVFAADGTQLFAAGSFDNTVSVWDIPSRTRLRRWEMAEAPMCVAVSPDGKTLVAGGYHGALSVFDLETNAAIFQIALSDTIRVVRFFRGNRYLLSAGDDGVMILLDLEQRRILTSWIDHSRGVRALAIAPDQQSIVTAGNDGRVVWRQLSLSLSGGP